MIVSKILSPRIFKKSLIGGLIAIFSTLTIGCNEDWQNLLTTEYPDPTANHLGKNNRVLLITVDGVSGTALTEVGDLNLPTLTAMKRNALFSYRSLTDYEDINLDYPIAYANLFTGVSFSKHGYTGDVDNSNLSIYPSFIKRIKEQTPSSKIAIFSSNEDVLNPLVNDADVKSFSSSDEEVVNNVVNHIANEDSDITVVTLSDADQIGAQDGYNANVSTYADEVKAIDSKINKIKTALQSRDTYKQENWLVIITGSQGANSESGSLGPSAYDDLRKNSFTLFYNDKFNSVPIAVPNTDQIPFSSKSPVFNGTLSNNNTALIPDDGGLYNFGTDDFTIRFTMKGSGVERTWPVFLSKGGRIDDSGPGWRLYISRKLLSIQVGGNGGWSNWGTNLVVNDGNWHNVVIVFFKDNGVRKVKAFVDGVKSTAIQDINGRPGMTNNEPVRIGRNRDDAELPDIQMNHLQFYRHAWTDEEVINNACKVEVSDVTPHYNQLVGYWPANEGAGTILKNYAPIGEGKDFVLQGAYSWKTFNDISEVLCPIVNEGFYKIVPNAVDIPYTIYNWMGVPVRGQWNLDGRVWSFNYNNIKP